MKVYVVKITTIGVYSYTDVERIEGVYESKADAEKELEWLGFEQVNSLVQCDYRKEKSIFGVETATEIANIVETTYHTERISKGEIV